MKTPTKFEQLTHFMKCGIIAYIAITLLAYAGTVAAFFVLCIGGHLLFKSVTNRFVGNTIKNSMGARS